MFLRLTDAARLVIALALLIFAVVAVAQVDPRDRVILQIDSRAAVPLRGSVSALARPEFDQGAVDPAMPIQRMMIFFERTPAQQSAMDTLMQQQQHPTSANYHQWLTPEEVGERFGLSQNDLAKVQSW